MCGLSTFPPAGSSRKRNGKAAAAKVGAVAWASAKPQREQPGAAGRGTEKPRPPKREQQPRQARSHRGSSRETPWDAATGRRRRAGGGRALISEQQKKRGDSAPPTAARDDPAPKREQQPRQAQSHRGSSSPGKHTRGGQPQRPQRGREGARKKAKTRSSPGRATRPTEQGQRGKGTGPASPKAATSTGRRRPRDETPPHVAFRTQQPKGEARRSKVKQGEARYFALSRAREGSFLFLILGNISYLRKIPETFKKSSIYAVFGWILFKLFLYIFVVDLKKER